MKTKNKNAKKRTKKVTKYYLHPSVHYIPRSPDEVLLRGGHLEGYSLVITDETKRGLAGAIVGCIFEPAGIENIYKSISKKINISKDELVKFLDKIAQSGAIAKVSDDIEDVSSWLGFTLYGALPAESKKKRITIAGDELADHLANYLRELTIDVEKVSFDDLGSLDRFSINEEEIIIKERTKETCEDSETDFNQLIVCVSGISIIKLYEINEAAIAKNVPILYIQAAGSEAIIGPYVDAGSTACFWEFEQQRISSFFSQTEYEEVCNTNCTENNKASLHVQMSTVINAAPFIVELAFNGRSSLAGAYKRIRTTTSEMENGSIIRLPRCPVCLPKRPLLRNLGI